MRQRSYAFGLNLDLACPVEGCPERPWVDGCPELVMELTDPPAGDVPPAERVALTEDGEGGYRLALAGVGHFAVLGDGRLLCSRQDGGDGSWDRFMVAQILPLAAVVAGLEVLHASCVAFEGMAVGFVGPSGTGKSTMAARMVGGGATFMADDVLAISEGAGRPFVHPGANLVRLAPGPPVAAGETAPKMTRELIPTDQGCPLGVLYFLSRSDTATEVQIEPRVGAAELLAATFNLVVQSPERLERQLAVMAQADACGAPVRAIVPAGMPAPATARALREDAAERVGALQGQAASG